MKNKQATPASAKPLASGASGATTGCEAELWAAANALRGNMDAAIAGNLAALGFGLAGRGGG